MRRLVYFRPFKTKTSLTIPVIAFAIVLCVALITMIAMPIIGLDRAQAADPVKNADSVGSWTKEAGAGFGSGSDSFMAWPMADYKGALYVGVGNKKGSEVRVKNGSSWGVVAGSALGFGNANNMAILCMKVYNNKLYAGTLNYNQGCEIWCYDGGNWTEVIGGSVYGPGFGYPSNMAAFCMEVHANKLYIGTLNLSVTAWPPSSLGAQIWTYDGAICQPDMSGGFGDTRNYAVTALKEYNGTLYAGTLCVAPNYLLTSWWTVDVILSSQGCQLWSLGASSWNKVAGDGFGRMENAAVGCMEVFDNKLIIGTASGIGTISVTFSPSVSLDDFSWKSAGLGVYGYTSGGLTAIKQSGLEDANDFGILAMIVAPINGKDYLLAAVDRAVDNGSGTTSLSGYVAAYDGSKWFRASEDGFGNSDNEMLTSLEALNGKLYAGTMNRTEGCEVWSVDPNTPTEPLVIFSFYFAEGYTGTGFQEYLSIGNPTAAQADATITYMFKDGGTQPQTVSIPANSRATVDVNAAVGADKDVSAKVESEQQIVVERPMYFNYQNKWTGGHDVVGATAPAYTWYFAEGYTGAGFDEWVCVLNPESTTADLTFYFQTQEAGEKVIAGRSVPPNSRQTFKANDLLGGTAYQTSLTLTSSGARVVAERPIYFDYTGTGNWHWNGGHCVMGTTNLASNYYFAEGTTRPGFEEWLTLQNPGLANLTVNAVYQLGPGQGDPVTKSYQLPASSRQTVFVPKEVGTDKDVSVYLSCSSAFLAERPMYFNYGFGSLHATGGHCVIGAGLVGTDWFLAEGFTGSNFNEWLCLQNPGDADAVCEVTYYTQESGALPARQVTIPAKTRKTVMVNEDAGPNYQLSARVRVTSGPGIVVERPMYFIFRGWSGGHDVVGFL